MKNDLSPVLWLDAPESTIQDEEGDLAACTAELLELFLLLLNVVLILALCISCWRSSNCSLVNGVRITRLRYFSTGGIPFIFTILIYLLVRRLSM